MLLMKWRMVVDSLCGRKRRVPCSFWFLLLFAAGGLVLFIHQQDLSEMAQQQGPGVKLGSTPRQSRETLSTQDRRRGKSDNYQDLQTAEDILSSPIPPMQFPHFEKSGQMATPGSPEQDIGLIRVSKRQRKLLKTTPPIHHTTNNVSFSSSSSSTSSSSSSSSSVLSSSASVLSSSATGSLSLERWRKLSNILEARRQLMKEMCAKYKSSISRTVTRHHVKDIFVEDKYKLLYCQVPKAGCSNWKRTLIVLAGKASDIQNLKHDTVHNGNHLRTLNSFDQKGIMYRLKTYTKVMFVREPLERLVSAYRDKFENPNDYYHSLFGKPIINKYRVNASKAALETGNGVTFHEFVQYLLDVHRPVGMDIHWEQANQICNPCHIDYDFIGKFENMEEESNFLLRLTGAPPNVRLPSFKDRNPADKKTSTPITQKYFSQVSMLERQRVYDFYYMDYLMFNYSKPFKDLY
ncbi:carbohydrate sulfotransferase 8-like [Thunnus albacares]|uniref:carbohydrate sulfotransferase 8-like n=1 Tax=Thunnus maccoyii TaxID=8240 RepID=UPI001C4CF3B4|nr:carbohydrate sulfotransferase 8-like [Thunnus maccoyii]XP_042277844.1 carbohydrate sulfotransferase 8-like [Thunnus maccoyii]XP_044230785.1 carbohydrate sulfotransferase 8-like [Thunnus albacares]XP_044230858.1 carbohydrate sulfotransferase 8-like [Thunnus albacares]XP_044230943.1 carbohydrate sulfotransferase 8-like [Thunnus albacares]